MNTNSQIDQLNYRFDPLYCPFRRRCPYYRFYQRYRGFGPRRRLLPGRGVGPGRRGYGRGIWF